MGLIDQKRWSIGNYVNLIKLLNDEKITIIIGGGNDEESILTKKQFPL